MNKPYVRQGFLYLPKSIKGDLRWLTKAKWVEVYTCDGLQEYTEALYWVD